MNSDLSKLLSTVDLSDSEKKQIVQDFNISITGEFLGFLGKNYPDKLNQIAEILKSAPKEEKSEKVRSFIKAFFDDPQTRDDIKSIYTEKIEAVKAKYSGGTN